MPTTNPVLVQIPPNTSPVLQPSHRQRSPSPINLDDHYNYTNHHNPDIPSNDDLHFLPPGQWDDHHYSHDDDDDDRTEDGSDDADDDDEEDDDHVAFYEDDDVEDWSLEDGHIAGVPCANVVLHAKQYQTPVFLDQLLQLLRNDLAIPGWESLPNGIPSSLIQVHKVSGSLTNAVFFVSIPEAEADVEVVLPYGQGEGDVEIGTPLVSNSAKLFPATVFGELERGRNSASTPTPGTPANGYEESAPSTPQVKNSQLPLPGAPDQEEEETEHTTMPGALDLDDDDSPSPSASPSRRESGAQTPETASSLPPIRTQTQTSRRVITAPTLLLRIYGPQSGSLISRRTELHILHTLSSKYNIGAHVLGTFSNGRVEEYFHSRALDKEEMRDPRVSRWIGRRMRELHSVELEQMIPPAQEGGGGEADQLRRDESQKRRRDDRSRSPPASGRGDSLERRPGPAPIAGGGGNRSPVSGASVYSTSSSSSVFSFGSSSSYSSSHYSSSSTRSSSTLGSGGSGGGSYGSYGSQTSLVSSPLLLPQRESSESPAPHKKRPRRRGGSVRSDSGTSSSGGRRKKEKAKLCVWENILRWTREARLVLKELDELAKIPGFEKLLEARSSASTPAGPGGVVETNEEGEQTTASGARASPLSHPSLLFELRSQLNLPLFEQQLRQYRTFVRRTERGGNQSSFYPSTSSSASSSSASQTPTFSFSHPLKSRRVFSHNDTQYGNLLLVTPKTDDPREEEEIERQARREGGAHRRLMVIDFEYAGANPRGFDIANHFCEWQADYHHPSLSHSLSAHQPYPTRAERIRFLRAYVGCDNAYDGPSPLDDLAPREGDAGGAREDPRVERLLDEVKLWEPSSHAMWTVWGIVQAKEDLMARIAVWRERAQRAAGGEGSTTPSSPSSAHSFAAASSPSADQTPPAIGPVSPLSLVEQVQELHLSPSDVEELKDLGELEDVGEVFDYLSYAGERMEMFRRELGALGVV